MKRSIAAVAFVAPAACLLVVLSAAPASGEKAVSRDVVFTKHVAPILQKSWFNPNPRVEVSWGDQTWEEMMIGFADFYYDKPAAATGPGGSDPK